VETVYIRISMQKTIGDSSAVNVSESVIKNNTAAWGGGFCAISGSSVKITRGICMYTLTHPQMQVKWMSVHTSVTT